MENKQEAYKLFQDSMIHTIAFVNSDDEGKEFVDYYSFFDLIERHKDSINMGRAYQDLNIYLKNLSLYSLDSFLFHFNDKRTELVLIAHTLKKDRPEFQVLAECGSLIELIRDDILRLINEKEYKVLRPFIQIQLETINQEKEIIPKEDMSRYIDYFFESVKALFNFNKLKPSDISNFRLTRADPRIIRQQMLEVIEKNLI